MLHWRQIVRHKRFPFFLFLALTIFVRFFNFREYLYFIWDQGRDAVVLSRMAQGDLVLVGPTSGLQGFFLGPLWYYLGLPGYLLSGGSPYGISLWYVALGCLALPLYWLLARRLFPKSRALAAVTAYALALVPGSVQASTFVWNPLLSLPLMAGAYLALAKARQSRLWLALGFFLLALTLQSEFAYAVFFLGPLFFLIPWLRQKKNWLDFAAAGTAAAVTLLPQALFEWRNKFIMTNSLLRSLRDPSLSITWIEQVKNRPLQLFTSSVKLLLGQGQEMYLPGLLALALIVATIIWLWRRTKKDGDVLAVIFEWRLLALLAVLPYPFYLVWRGNYGNFFDYYLTPHFIFLMPLLILGLTRIKFIRLFAARDLALVAGGFLLMVGWNSLFRSVLFPVNNAGLGVMERAVETMFSWSKADGEQRPVFRFYTPNRETEHYDFITHWKARQLRREIPRTVRRETDRTIYVLLEPDVAVEQRFRPWYTETTKGLVRVRQTEVGVLIIESWMAVGEGVNRGLIKAEP